MADLSCQLGEHVTSTPPKGAKSIVRLSSSIIYWSTRIQWPLNEKINHIQLLFLCRSGTPGGRRVTSCRARWQDTLHMLRWHSGKRGIFHKKVTISGFGKHRFEARIESARLKSFESARLLTCPHPHCDNCDKTNAMLSMAFSEPSWIFQKTCYVASIIDYAAIPKV